MQSTVLGELHEGHLRISWMKALAHRFIRWPRLDKILKIWSDPVPNVRVLEIFQATLFHILGFCTCRFCRVERETVATVDQCLFQMARNSRTGTCATATQTVEVMGRTFRANVIRHQRTPPYYPSIKRSSGLVKELKSALIN